MTAQRPGVPVVRVLIFTVAASALVGVGLALGLFGLFAGIAARLP